MYAFDFPYSSFCGTTDGTETQYLITDLNFIIIWHVELNWNI